MKLIQDNPYRIAGILANASEKEIQKQKGKISKYASIGRPVESEFDFAFLGGVDRSENSINKAFSSIEQNHDKVYHSLFWFLNASPFDEAAIKYLTTGDIEKASEIWEKVTFGKEITSKNYSCLNNIGTLKLLGETKEEVKVGIEAKIKLIESSSFAEFVHNVADQTYTLDNQKQAEKFVDALLSQLKARYSSTETLELFGNSNGSTHAYLLKKLTDEPISAIESNIESTKTKRKGNSKDAYKFGLGLYTSSKNDLDIIKSLLGTSDLNYKMVADNLAKEIMQCGIDYFKAWEDTKDPSVEGIQLLKHAKSIATSQQTIDRIDSNIEGMEEFKDKEISQAIDLLRSIMDAYNENLIKISIQVAKMPLADNQTISQRKVDKMIVQSIDWDKVVEIVLKVIPQKNVDIIRQTNDTVKLKSYKSLVEYILSKLNYSQKKQIKYLRFWKKENTFLTSDITLETFPLWAKLIIAIVIILVIVAMIGGEEGLLAVFHIVVILVGFSLLGLVLNYLNSL